MWEEQYGFHLYTRLVQYKFLLDCKRYNVNQVILTNDVISHMKNLLNHHIDGENIFSSFTTDGKILRVYDSSVLLGLNHVDYDDEIFCFLKILSIVTLIISIPGMNNKNKISSA